MAKTKILLVDDHAVVRAGYRKVLEGGNEFQIVAEANNGEAAVKAYNKSHPDVTIMDLSMPGIGGLEAIRRILHRKPDACILAFSMHEHLAFVEQALVAGARGYLTKASEPEVIVEAVRTVAAGNVYLHPAVAQKLALQKTRGDRSPITGLSTREFEIFCLVAEGYTVGDIGAKLSLSSKTIANYVTQIKAKLGVATSAEIARLAIRSGFLKP